MTKISNETVYVREEDVTELDYLIGTDGDSTVLKTKNFNIGLLKKFFLSGISPETGGVLRFSEITYTGPLDNAADVVNNLNPDFTVDRYHVVVVSVNGIKSMFKTQNTTIGAGSPDVLETDFIVFPASVGAKGDDGIGITSIAKTNTVDLVDTYTITYSDSTTSTFTVTNGENGTNGTNGTNGATGPQGPAGTNGTNGTNGKGITSIAKTVTSGLVDTYTITYSDATTSTFQVTNGSQGVQGTQGIQGVQGLTGPAGPTGPQGPAGNDYTSNLQKTITHPTDFPGGNYVVSDSDNNYSIFIENGANNVGIVFPAGLMSKIQVGFIQKGSGEVVAIQSGTTIKFLTGLGLKMTGIEANAYAEQQGSSNIIQWMGNIKA